MARKLIVCFCILQWMQSAVYHLGGCFDSQRLLFKHASFHNVGLCKAQCVKQKELQRVLF